MSAFEFYPLDRTFDRLRFDCGSQALNDFLKSKARQNQAVGFNTTFVAIKSNDTAKRVLGFYSLSMGELDLSSLPEAVRRRLPKHPVPIARMGRLAVDKKAQGQGLGKLLLVDSMLRVKAASGSVGVHALLVDAKDETAKAFYQKYGFLELADKPLCLFLPLASFPD